MKKITALDILKMKGEEKNIPVLTAYSFPMARLIDEAGIPAILVGDSAGMVEAGYETTLPVTVDEMIYHTRSVSRAVKRALVIADMPFLSYQTGMKDTCRNAGRLVKEAGAEAVKVEGGRRIAKVIKKLIDIGIPVMAHVGLTPQSVLNMGGYRVQGRVKHEAEAILEDALAVEEAGAFSVVLECVPRLLAKKITGNLKIPVIGIGAGPHCDGQVLVLNDMLGLTLAEPRPRFVKQYADLKSIVSKAVREYIRDVQGRKFPSSEHGY
ncbi:MAG: 3-methyl-2-oxobutanoate hydroxymethyltransferase [Deltaproteobacteria bacterium]|nr:3-methyl-2-oxobutanoate hydroxymethyltransferase [Deltaproteobacteria bacterium]